MDAHAALNIYSGWQRVREIERKWPLRGLEDPQSLLQSFDPPVLYHTVIPTEGHQKGLMKSSQSQGPEQSALRSVNLVNKRQQQTELRINVSKKTTWEVWSITAVTAETCLPFLRVQQLSDSLYNSFRGDLNFTVSPRLPFLTSFSEVWPFFFCDLLVIKNTC